MISKIKAATDLQIKGLMLLKRSKILELLSKSFKELNVTMTSLKNFERSFLQKVQVNIT